MDQTDGGIIGDIKSTVQGWLEEQITSAAGELIAKSQITNIKITAEFEKKK